MPEDRPITTITITNEWGTYSVSQFGDAKSLSEMFELWKQVMSAAAYCMENLTLEHGDTP